jgi:ferredoxin-type protein NapH
VGGLFLAQVQNLETIMFWSFILGNAIYYIVGIVLAYAMKDNRAFCKYICPITVFLKPASYYSLTRVTVDPDKCITCNKCKKICPMNVDMLDNRRSRLNGTECILCMACVKSCPKNALKM